MNSLEKDIVKLIAKTAPWLAPFPSAFFVARASMEHLALPLFVAAAIAATIETLGLSTVHTALWLSEWNASKRKSDPSAPVILAVALGAVYVMATVGLTIFLEVMPSLATYAPALFPALAVVGAVNLALVAQQERREAAVRVDKAERKASRKGAGTKAAAVPVAVSMSGTKDRAMAILAATPGISGSELGRKVGRSARMGRKLKTELLPVLEGNGRG